MRRGSDICLEPILFLSYFMGSGPELIFYYYFVNMLLSMNSFYFTIDGMGAQNV